MLFRWIVFRWVLPAVALVLLFQWLPYADEQKSPPIQRGNPKPPSNQCSTVAFSIHRRDDMLLLIVLQHRRPHRRDSQPNPVAASQISIYPQIHWARPSNSVFGNRRGFCSLRQRPISDGTGNLVSWGFSMPGFYLWEAACQFPLPIPTCATHCYVCVFFCWVSRKSMHGYAGLPCHGNAPNLGWPSKAGKNIFTRWPLSRKIILWHKNVQLWLKAGCARLLNSSTSECRD